MRTAGLSAKPISRRSLRFLGLFLLLGDVGAAQAQSIATPLTFQDCLQRQRDLRAEAKQASDRAWDIVGRIVGWGNTESKALYQKANELREAASALHCAYHPDKAPSDASEIQEKSDKSINLLAKGIKAGPEEASTITNKIIKFGTDHAIEESVLDKLTITPSTELKEYIQDRLKDVEAHNRTVMSQLDKTGEAISQVGQGDGVGTPTGYGQVNIDYSRIGSLGTLSGGNSDVTGDGGAVRATGNGTVSVDYTKMFAADYKKGLEDKAVAERKKVAAEREQAAHESVERQQLAISKQAQLTQQVQRNSTQARPIQLPSQMTGGRGGCYCDNIHGICCDGTVPYNCTLAGYGAGTFTRIRGNTQLNPGYLDFCRKMSRPQVQVGCACDNIHGVCCNGGRAYSCTASGSGRSGNFTTILAVQDLQANCRGR